MTIRHETSGNVVEEIGFVLAREDSVDKRRLNIIDSVVWLRKSQKNVPNFTSYNVFCCIILGGLIFSFDWSMDWLIDQIFVVQSMDWLIDQIFVVQSMDWLIDQIFVVQSMDWLIDQIFVVQSMDWLIDQIFVVQLIDWLIDQIFVVQSIDWLIDCKIFIIFVHYNFDALDWNVHFFRYENNSCVYGESNQGKMKNETLQSQFHI